MFCGSHSGLNRRTSKAVLELIEIVPQVAHLRLLGTVILGPVLPNALSEKNRHA